MAAATKSSPIARNSRMKSRMRTISESESSRRIETSNQEEEEETTTSESDALGSKMESMNISSSPILKQNENGKKEGESEGVNGKKRSREEAEMETDEVLPSTPSSRLKLSNSRPPPTKRKKKCISRMWVIMREEAIDLNVIN